MMEGISLQTLAQILGNLGLPGLILVLWYVNDRTYRRTLDQYKGDMAEQRKMYDDNVELVKTTQSLAGDLKDVVIMNTQAWQKASDGIEGNQFCPQVRLEKKAEGVVK